MIGDRWWKLWLELGTNKCYYTCVIVVVRVEIQADATGLRRAANPCIIRFIFFCYMFSDWKVRSFYQWAIQRCCQSPELSLWSCILRLLIRLIFIIVTSESQVISLAIAIATRCGGRIPKCPLYFVFAFLPSGSFIQSKLYMLHLSRGSQAKKRWVKWCNFSAIGKAVF